MTKKLPKKLSALLRLAVRDAKACEKAPNYKLVMRDWHFPNKTEKVCQVCMAGAVMANTLRVPWGRIMGPHAFNREAAALYAINSMRNGFLAEAYDQMNAGSVPHKDEQFAIDTAGRLIRGSFDFGPALRAPWPVYLKAATILAKAGL